MRINKIKWLIISGIGAIIITYIIFSIGSSIKNRHSFTWNAYDNYIWLFNDSARKYIDTKICLSYYKKKDNFTHYIFKGKYYISIWEFKEIGITNLNRNKINLNVYLQDFRIESGEILNDESSPEISIKYNVDFTSSLNINLDEYSKIDTSFNEHKYKGFYGIINKFSLSNQDNNHAILFDFPSGKQPVLLIMYSFKESLFLLTIDSDNPFNPNELIKIFNFK